MSPEREQKYFSRFESENLPGISWQEMLERRLVITPVKVRKCLEEAEKLLVTSPGPNLEKRRKLAPEWFGYWKELLKSKDQTEDEFTGSGEKFISFEVLGSYLKEKYQDERTGMLFVAGAEGHKGHIHAARYMNSVVPVTIWGFEQESYMLKKERKYPFLPLKLRLSMWFYEPSITHITVLPENTSGLAENEHYDSLFTRSGARYFFVHQSDPYLMDKLKRGEKDLDTIIHQDFPVIRTSDAVMELSPETDWREADRLLAKFYTPRVIPDMETPSTTERLKFLRSESPSGLPPGDLLDPNLKQDFLLSLMGTDFGYKFDESFFEE